MGLQSVFHYGEVSRLKPFNNTIVFNKELHYDCNNKMIEKENNISYKLTNVIAGNNGSSNSYCIKENGKIVQFIDNYFIDVQKINFWQSEFNDTSHVDVPLITGEFYERYFDDDMDLTSLF
uniref:Uncharacterized protein n=1 Tax=Strongyloides venezuelensis TaxID=75913 RepID=A0A0K0FT58_STRVS